MPANFNQITTEGLTFPTLNITEAEAKEKSNPTVRDPGFIVEDTHGNWEWFANFEDAFHHQTLGPLEGLAVYMAAEVSPIFAQFARDVHFNKDGSETYSDTDPYTQK